MRAAAAAAAAVMMACSRAAEEEKETPGGVSLSAFARGPFEQDGTMFTAAWGKILLLLVLRRAPAFPDGAGAGGFAKGAIRESEHAVVARPREVGQW